MSKVMIARLRRGEALEMAQEAGIRGFHGIALAGMDRREALELIEQVVYLYPSDHERRGERLRRLARGV